MTKTENVKISRLSADGDLLEIHDVPIIWVEQVRPIVFQGVGDPSFQLGALDTINWVLLRDIAPYLLKLACYATGLNEANFTISSMYRYTDEHNIAHPGVGIFLRSDADISTECLSKLDEFVINFAHCVVFNPLDTTGQKSLFDVTVNEDICIAIANVVDEFQSKFGGKAIGEARFIRTRNLEVFLAGRVKQKKDCELPTPTRWSLAGKIDGIRGRLRAIYIAVSERKTVPVQFDEAKFLEMLLPRVLDEKVYEFELEMEWIAVDRSITNLISLQ